MEATPRRRHKTTTATSSPSPTTTRQKLDASLETRIIRDLEDPRIRNLKFSEVCVHRPDYGAPDSSLRSAVRNRFYYFKKLKREDVKRYWRQYSAASTGKPIQSSGADDSESEDIPSSHSDQGDNSSGDEGYRSVSSVPSATSQHRNWQSPRETPRFRHGKPQPILTSPPASSSPIPKTSNSMSSKTKSSAFSAANNFHGSSVKTKGDSKNESQGMFASMEEAEEYGSYFLQPSSVIPCSRSQLILTGLLVFLPYVPTSTTTTSTCTCTSKWMKLSTSTWSFRR